MAASHDSYLINLSSPDRRLWRISQKAFAAELERSAALGLDFVVTHPGNAIDGDLAAGIERNARGIVESLEAGPEDGPRVLLELTQKGMSREDAYRAVQRNAMEVWHGNGAFLNLLKADNEIGRLLANDELESLFDLGYHTKHVDTIFDRVFAGA